MIIITLKIGLLNKIVKVDQIDARDGTKSWEVRNEFHKTE